MFVMFNIVLMLLDGCMLILLGRRTKCCSRLTSTTLATWWVSMLSILVSSSTELALAAHRMCFRFFFLYLQFLSHFLLKKVAKAHRIGLFHILCLRHCVRFILFYCLLWPWLRNLVNPIGHGLDHLLSTLLGLPTQCLTQVGHEWLALNGEELID